MKSELNNFEWVNIIIIVINVLNLVVCIGGEKTEISVWQELSMTWEWYYLYFSIFNESHLQFITVRCSLCLAMDYWDSVYSNRKAALCLVPYVKSYPSGEKFFELQNSERHSKYRSVRKKEIHNFQKDPMRNPWKALFLKNVVYLVNKANLNIIHQEYFLY